MCSTFKVLQKLWDLSIGFRLKWGRGHFSVPFWLSPDKHGCENHFSVTVSYCPSAASVVRRTGGDGSNSSSGCLLWSNPCIVASWVPRSQSSSGSRVVTGSWLMHGSNSASVVVACESVLYYSEIPSKDPEYCLILPHFWWFHKNSFSI